MRLERLFPVLLAAYLVGCATPAPQRAAIHVKTNALLTQRAVLTIRGRQFTLNGYLALSERLSLIHI